MGIVPKKVDTSDGESKRRIASLPVPVPVPPDEKKNLLIESNKARQAHNEAKNAFSSTERELQKEEEARDKLFDPKWYGKEGEWRKLDNTCLSKDTGEYTYSVCLFGSATQKSNRDGVANNLG